MKNVNISSMLKTVWIFIPLLIWYAFGWAIFPYFLKNATLPEEIEGKMAFPLMPYIIAGFVFIIAIILAIIYLVQKQEIRE